MKIYGKDCSEEEVGEVEGQWIALGYRLVKKRAELELQPMEYLKRSYTLSLEGRPRRWSLVRRELDH